MCGRPRSDSRWLKCSQTSFIVGKAASMKYVECTSPLADVRLVSPTAPSAAQIISSSKRHTPTQRRTFLGIQRLFSSGSKKAKNTHASYRPTYDKVVDGSACRIYGSVEVKKVTANLHVTTLGHGYMSYEHTDHHREYALCDLSDLHSDEPIPHRPRVLLRPLLPCYLATFGP